MSKRLFEKLERYEQEAYEGGYGSDYLEAVGEGFKFYIQQCSMAGTRPTIIGFEKYIDGLHSEKK
ncbi:MAG: hypothetical protein RSF40_01400 [Oscillospiraceae bacterium]